MWFYIDCSKYKLNLAKSSLEKLRFGLSATLSISLRDEYGNNYPPYEGEHSKLTLPVREGIEILSLSVSPKNSTSHGYVPWTK